MQACACRMWQSNFVRMLSKTVSNPSRIQMISGDTKEKINQVPVDDIHIQFPEEPTTCCMSGCSNCVWIQYAEELSKLLGSEGPQKAQEMIMERVTDPNIRAYLLTELTILRNKLS